MGDAPRCPGARGGRGEGAAPWGAPGWGEAAATSTLCHILGGCSQGVRLGLGLGGGTRLLEAGRWQRLVQQEEPPQATGKAAGPPHVPCSGKCGCGEAAIAACPRAAAASLGWLEPCPALGASCSLPAPSPGSRVPVPIPTGATSASVTPWARFSPTAPGSPSGKPASRGCVPRAKTFLSPGLEKLTGARSASSAYSSFGALVQAGTAAPAGSKSPLGALPAPRPSAACAARSFTDHTRYTGLQRTLVEGN